MRKEFKLTEVQLEELLRASRPIMVIGKAMPITLQENTNAVWAALGRELGFKFMTVKPVAGKGYEFFTAEIEL